MSRLFFLAWLVSYLERSSIPLVLSLGYLDCLVNLLFSLVRLLLATSCTLERLPRYVAVAVNLCWRRRFDVDSYDLSHSG